MRQQLRELSVTSRRGSVSYAVYKTSPSAAGPLSPTAAGLRRLQLSQGVLGPVGSKPKALGGAGGVGEVGALHSWGGASPVVQSRSPSRVWGETTPPLHPSSPKAGLSALRKQLRWGKPQGQSSPLVPQLSSPSGHAAVGPQSPSAPGLAAVQFSDPSRSATA